MYFSNSQPSVSKFLIIQTAFIGDVILATAIVEKLKQFYPEASIDFLVRKGNENLLQNNPHIRNVLVWNKKENKLSNFLKTSLAVRNHNYDYIINPHRFASSGLITFMSGAKYKIGFKKNPFSFFYTKSFEHNVNNGKHETQRNQLLIQDLTDDKASMPRLYPGANDFNTAKHYKEKKYYCVAPSSVWYTKQLPKQKWIELINKLDNTTNVYLLGSPTDYTLCEEIRLATTNCINLAGKLSFLESAALIKDAAMNFVNDSAPLHIASAMNAPVSAFFCSTIPEFGFGPLSENKKIIQTNKKLMCRPCGLHGYNECPQKHFECANTININQALQ